MKKIVLSIVAVVGMSSFGFADEGQAPVTSTEIEESSENKDEGLYLGLAYTHLSLDVDKRDETIVSEMDFSALTLQAGYKFNPYIAVEGRYGISLDDPDVEGALPIGDAEITVWGIYVNPMYPVAPEFDIYALLGYAGTNVEGSFRDGRSFDVDDSSFSWGLGGTYAITEEFSVFADYLLFYDASDEFDKVVDSFNFGVSYQF